MTARKSKMLFLSAALATFITYIGWAGTHLPSSWLPYYIVGLPGFDIFAGLLSMPGIFLAVFLAMIFSPQGGHGEDQFAWLIPPVNWLFYFLLFFAIFRRKGSNEQTQIAAPEVSVGKIDNNHESEVRPP